MKLEKKSSKNIVYLQQRISIHFNLTKSIANEWSMREMKILKMKPFSVCMCVCVYMLRDVLGHLSN